MYGISKAESQAKDAQRTTDRNNKATSRQSMANADADREARVDASNAAIDATRQQLDFQKKQIDDWKNIFGDVESNLSEYYSSLTPDFYATQGLQAFEEERTAADTNFRERLAQKGIVDGGLIAEIESERNLDSAETRAGIRSSADEKVANQKAQFLQIGMGSDPTAGMSTALANQANQAGNRSAQAASISAVSSGNVVAPQSAVRDNTDVNAAYAAGIPTAASALSDMYRRS